MQQRRAEAAEAAEVEAAARLAARPSLEARGIKVILDGREQMESGGAANPAAGEVQTDPLCGYGVEGGGAFQPESGKSCYFLDYG